MLANMQGSAKFAINLALLLSITCQLDLTKAQSNYVQQADSSNYTSNGLPEEATLDGKVTKLDDISPLIFLNRTKAALNCAAGSMEVDMKFDEPFHGIIQADYDRSSACRVNGKGALSYRLDLPLKGCGTIQSPTRVFTNNIIVRFHANLEMDGDEIITIVCRYPPPIPSLPPALPAPILEPIAAGSIIQPPLKGVQILMIICAIMFLTILLLGLAVSYYCLNRRPIPVVRRLPMSLGSGSEITKLSGSGSVVSESIFEGVKIPRAHAPLAAVQSSSGSEGVLIPSDYPSESHSEIEEIDTRSLPFSSAGSFDNRGFVHETSSIYSDHYGHTQETPVANAVVTRPPIAPKESPKFDIQMRVKKSPPPPPSPVTSDTESIVASRPDRNVLSTIMESHEDRESVMTLGSLPVQEETMYSQFTYLPDIHPQPQETTITIPPPAEPVFSVYARTHHDMERGRETWSDYTDGPALSEVPEQRSEQHDIETEHLTVTDYYPEAPIAVKKPQVTAHTVDDVFLRTITEKKTIEDIESHKRRVTEYKSKPKPLAPPPPPEPVWDVKIRKYLTEPEQMQWENFSDISSASGMTLTPKMERSELTYQVRPPPPPQIDDNNLKLTSPELVGKMKTVEMPPEDKDVPNWDVLIRILEEPEMYEADDVSSVHSSVHQLTRHISYEDKEKWKQIITTESILRTKLTEAVVREDFERIRMDTRYERIFEPHTWDVIIRVLAPTSDDEGDIDAPVPKRNKTRQPWDQRSRRSSLPTLYEYDSDGGSSIRTIRDHHHELNINSYAAQRMRRSSRSSYHTDQNDFRSMSEVTVDFGRAYPSDNASDTSSFYRPHFYDDEDRRSFQRSMSHPSLARSASEFTEHWVAPEDYSSPEGTPKSKRSARLPTFQAPVVSTPPPAPRAGRMVAQTQREYMEQRTSSLTRTQVRRDL